MATLIQRGLFGDDEIIDTEEEKRKAETKKKRSQAARKAAETRRTKKETAKQNFNKNLHTAREKENLFGEKPSEEERKEAEDYIQKHFKDKELQKSKSSEGLERKIANIVREEVERFMRML